VLLLTMLKIAGIKAFPALVPANGKYFDETAPSLQAFNHVIAVALLKDKYFWLDATNETAAFNSPPFYPDKSLSDLPGWILSFFETLILMTTEIIVFKTCVTK